MEHEPHIGDLPGVGRVAYIVAGLAIIAMLLGAGVFWVYASGIWNPPTHYSHQ